MLNGGSHAVVITTREVPKLTITSLYASVLGEQVLSFNAATGAAAAADARSAPVLSCWAIPANTDATGIT